MGYYSDVIIAVHRQTYTKHFLLDTIPQALNEVRHWKTEDACYWHINSWKFYDSYPPVQEIRNWLDALSEEPPITTTYTNQHGVERSYIRDCFGAMRLGEDRDDIEEWGGPDVYDIYLSQHIDFPAAPQEESPCDTLSSSSPTPTPSSS